MAGAGGDSTPDAFNFVDITNANPNTVTSSSTLTITGITGAVLVSSTGGVLFSINGDAFSSTQRVILSGQTLQLRLTTGSGFSTAYSGSVTVGDTTDSWSVTTRAADTTPTAFSFTDATGVERSTTTTSNTVTVSGLEPNFSITVSASGGTVDAGTSALSGTFASSKTVTTSGTGTLVVAARVTSSASFSTAVNCTVTIGSGSDIYTVTTRAADTTGTMTFTDQIGVSPSTQITSATVTATGFEPNYTFTISCSGGTIDAGTSTLSGTFATSKSVTTSGTGTFVVAARATSSSSFGGVVNVQVGAGNTSDTFTVTTRAADQEPTLTFTSATNVERSTVTTSSTTAATNLEPNHTFTISVTSGNGTIDVGTTTLSGTFATSKTVTTSGTGTMVIAVRGTSSSSFSTSVTINVNFGPGIVRTFTITTRAADTTPNTFSFTAATGVERSTPTTSATVTVSGLEPNFSITVSAGGTGTVDAGTSTLSGTFAASKVVTTSATGTLVVAAQRTSSTNFSTTVTVSITVGSGTATPYNITTRAADTTPAAFNFTDVTEATVSTVYTSNTVTVSGLEPSSSITVSASGGTIDAGTSALSGTFASSKAVTTTASGTLVVAARVTSSASFGTAANCTVTVGTGSDTYTVTTRAADTTPNAFTFTDVTNAQLSTLYQSNTVTVTGLEPNYLLTFSVGNSATQYDAGTATLSGTWKTGGTTSATVTTSASGTFVMASRVTSNSTFSGSTGSQFTIGGVSDTYTVTTRAADTTPNTFSFTDVTDAPISTTTTSNTVTVSGLEPNFSITVSASGGTVDAGTSALSGTFASSKTVTTSGTGTLVVAARVTSSASPSTATNCTVTIGGVSDTFTVTTTVDIVPNTFSLGSVTGVVPNSGVQTSGVITISGLSPNTIINFLNPFSFSGSPTNATGYWGTTTVGGPNTISYNPGGGFQVTTSASGTFVFKVDISAPSTGSATNTFTLTLNGVSGSFSVTTADITPNAFTFTSVTNQQPSTTVTSNTVTVTGLQPNFSITVSATGGLVDAGTSTLSGTFASSKTVTTSASGTLVVAARVTTGTFGSTTTANVTIGTGSANYSATVRNPDTVLETGLITNGSLVNGTPGVTYTSSSTLSSTLEPSTAVTIAATSGTVGLKLSTTSTLPASFSSGSATVTTNASGQFYMQYNTSSIPPYRWGYFVLGFSISIGAFSSNYSVLLLSGTTVVSRSNTQNRTVAANTYIPAPYPSMNIGTVNGQQLTVTMSGAAPNKEWSLDGTTWNTSNGNFTPTAGSTVIVYTRSRAPVTAGQSAECSASVVLNTPGGGGSGSVLSFFVTAS
jgi:hypothetical protein